MLPSRTALRTAPLRLTGLSLIALAASCDPCPPAQSVDDALTRACTLGDAGTPDTNPGVTCTPHSGTICTVVGTGEAGFGMENLPGPQTKLYLPQDVTMGPDGNAYFVDWNNHRIRVLTSNNIVRTVAGSGELSDSDATPSSMPTRMPEPALMARLNHPTNIAFDPQGHMLIAAWHNSEIKSVDLASGIMTSICGTGARGFGGDTGPALNAVLDLPVGVAISPSNEMYIADQANQRIRRVDSSGMISTVVNMSGMRGYNGDNIPALSAQLNNVVGQAAAPAGRIVFDSTGNLYIADTGNNRVRKVNTMGVITTVAGTGDAGYNGDNMAATTAQINGPTDVEIGPDGTLYIADTQNSCIRSVTADGNIHTVAGHCGMRGSSGDGMAPTDALLDRPYGIETDTQGNLWIADTYNQRVRLVCIAAGGTYCAH